MPDNATITPSQTKAIAALLSPDCHTNKQAAKRAGVGERTLQTWLAEDTLFRGALAGAQTAAIERASMRLVALTDAAIDALADALDPMTPHKYALRSAALVLDHVMKWRELNDHEQRLAALEGK